jgi:hypothetical protein
MTTVTTIEAAAALPELIERSRSETVVIRDGDRDVAYLISPEQMERERVAKVAAFREACHLASDELERSLAAEGISVEDFVADALKDL